VVKKKGGDKQGKGGELVCHRGTRPGYTQRTVAATWGSTHRGDKRTADKKKGPKNWKENGGKLHLPGTTRGKKKERKTGALKLGLRRGDRVGKRKNDKVAVDTLKPNILDPHF